MKICFFNTTRLWGGGEKWHLEHAAAFQKRGHQVCVVSNKNSELLKRADKQGIPTIAYRIGNLSFLNPFKLYSLYLFFKREKFDVLVMNFSSDLKVAASSATWAHIPRVVYRRGSDIPIRNTVLNRYLFGKCLTDIIANSEATKRSILAKNPGLFPESKIKVIYNGIDIHLTSMQETHNEVPIVGTLGRLVHQKGIDILLEVAAILKTRNVHCKIRIGGDGPLMNELVKKVRNKNIEDYVEFTGFVEQPDIFMNEIDVFVLPSRWEGFGYVLAEAMLARKPLVAFDISSNPELVQNNVNGYLIPFGDVEKFADAIQKLVEQPDTRIQLGNEGYRITCEKFDFVKNEQQVIDFLSRP